MQNRMKNHQLDKEGCEALLRRAEAGRISTVRSDGYPYTVSVHFLWRDGFIYCHGLNKGEKIENIKRCPKVCFEVSELFKVLTENIDAPCSADAAYESVVIIGDAKLAEDFEEKADILKALVKKYIPDREFPEMGEAAVKNTAVIKIKVREMTGKYHSQKV